MTWIKLDEWGKFQKDMKAMRKRFMVGLITGILYAGCLLWVRALFGDVVLLISTIPLGIVAIIIMGLFHPLD